MLMVVQLMLYFTTTGGGKSQNLVFYTCHPCEGKTRMCSECGKCFKRDCFFHQFRDQ